MTLWTIVAGNMEGLKSDILEFQLQFLTSDPYSNDIESNWKNFKQAILNAISTHVPQKLSSSNNKLPWITPAIKRLINRRNQFCTAKLNLFKLNRLGIITILSRIRSPKVLEMLTPNTRTTYLQEMEDPITKIFGNTFTKSVFTSENTTDMPNCNNDPYSVMSDITISHVMVYKNSLNH